MHCYINEAEMRTFGGQWLFFAAEGTYIIIDTVVVFSKAGDFYFTAFGAK
jgi:hypothetical protein